MNTSLRPLHPGVVVPVAGVSLNQDQISLVQIGDEVTLVHEVSNPFDPAAVRVEDAEGNKLGYVPRKAHLNERLIIGHHGGMWSGVVTDKCGTETVGLRVQINALIGTRNATFGSDAAGIRTLDVDAAVEQAVAAADPDTVADPGGSGAAVAPGSEPDAAPVVFTRSGRELGTLVEVVGTKTRVQTPTGVVAYPSSIVVVRTLQKTP